MVYTETVLENGLNGSRKVQYWILGIVSVLVVSAVSGSVSTAIAMNGRVSALETKHEAADKRLDAFEKRLDRFEGKLDHLGDKLDDLLRRVPK